MPGAYLGPLQPVEVHVGSGVEAHHLAPGVHTRIGTAGAGELDGVAKDELQGLAESPGHSGDVALEGKPPVGRPQVSDEQAEPAALYWSRARRKFRRARCEPWGRCRRASARA